MKRPPTTGKKKPRGRSFQPGNPWQFPPGISGNPGGRPHAITNAYNTWLAAERILDPTGRDENEFRTLVLGTGAVWDNKRSIWTTINAGMVAFAMGVAALSGDVTAAAELRRASELVDEQTRQAAAQVLVRIDV